MGPPDYLGIGVPRAGSSWIARLIASHPDVKKQTWGKELHYFDRFYDEDVVDPGEYYAYFPRPPGAVTGGWTPGYLYQPWTRPLIELLAPSALLLVSLRDPIEQITSSVNYSAYHGAPRNGLMVSRHLTEAAYAFHLRLWSDALADRLMVLQSEVAFDSPALTVRRIWSRLGLDPSVEVSPRLNRNEARGTTIELTESCRRMLVEYLEPDVRELAARFPEVDPGRWPNFAHLG